MTFKELVKSISKKEWHLIWAMIIVILVVTNIPYLIGILVAPSNTVYDGTHFLNKVDRYVYYSYLEQVKQGSYLFKNLYTSEVQSQSTLNVFWLSIGLLAKWFRLPNAVAFHLARIILAPLAIIIFYIIIAYFLKNIRWRKMAFVLFLFSSGWGAYSLSIFESFKGVRISIDLWMAEANTFFTLYYSSHFIVSLSLLLLIPFFILLALDNNKFKYSLIAGLLALILFQFHPYHFPTIFGLLFIYWLAKTIKDKKINWSIIFHSLIVVLISLPSLVYHFWLVQTDEIIALRAMQNITLTPPFIYVFFGYGFLLPLAVWGIIKLWQKRGSKFNLNICHSFFLACWLITGLGLIYFPLSFQRRLLEGLHFPMVILTTVALFGFMERKAISRMAKRLKPLVVIVFLLLFCFTSFFYLILDTNIFFYSSIQARDLFFRPKNELAALSWLKTHPSVQAKNLFFKSKDELIALDWLKNYTKPDSLILASYESNFIPGYTGRKVYVGHSHETIFFKRKYQEVNIFFQQEINDNYRQNFLKRNNIDYIYYSFEERKNSFFEPSDKDYLKPVYSNKAVTIYRMLD